MIFAVVAALLVLLTPRPAAAEKVFVYHLEGRPATLDPALALSEREIHVVWHLCDALVNVSRDGKTLEPGLAQSWTVSADGRTAVVKLRAGLVFHDGAVLDARAVKASFARHATLDEIYGAPQKSIKAQMLDELVAGIEVRDPLTVELALKYPGLHYLSQIEIVNPSAAARLGKEFGRQPDCSGPFKLDRWSDDRIVLAANDKYWAGRPRIDRLVFPFIADGRAVVDALLKHELHFTSVVPDPVFLERLRDSQAVKLVPVPGLNVFYLGFYAEKPPFADPSLRRAVAHGVNVTRLATFIGRGTLAPANGPLPPAVKGYDPAVRQAGNDPAAARELLAKAGHGAGLTLGLVHNSSITFQAEVAGAIQNDLRRVGITVELLGKPTWRDVLSAARAREGHGFVYGWYVRAPYPERLLVPLFHSKSIGTSNLTHYKNPTVDSLLDTAFRFPEGPGQAEMYTQIQRAIVADAPMVFLYHLTRMAAHTDRVHGLELNLGALPHDKLVTVEVAR